MLETKLKNSLRVFLEVLCNAGENAIFSNTIQPTLWQFVSVQGFIGTS